MYLIFTENLRKSTIEAIKRLYQKSDYTLTEYKIYEKTYLLSVIDPAKILPREILKNIRVSRISSEDSKKLFTTQIKEVHESMRPKQGKKVIITKGPYEGFKGTILKELGNGKYQVAVSVFGMSVPVEVEKEEIEVL